MKGFSFSQNEKMKVTNFHVTKVKGFGFSQNKKLGYRFSHNKSERF